MVTTYNVHNARPCRILGIGRALQRLGMGKAVVCLQEIKTWKNSLKVTGTGWVLHSSRGREDVSAGRLGFDCGFLVPEDLNPRIRLITHHRYWSGLVLRCADNGHVAIISAHFIHQRASEAETKGIHFMDELMSETIQFRQAVRLQFGKSTAFIAGLDANTSLPKWYAGVTGDRIAPPLKSHRTEMKHSVAEWLSTMRLSASNTWDPLLSQASDPGSTSENTTDNHGKRKHDDDEGVEPREKANERPPVQDYGAGSSGDCRTPKEAQPHEEEVQHLRREHKKTKRSDEGTRIGKIDDKVWYDDAWTCGIRRTGQKSQIDFIAVCPLCRACARPVNVHDLRSEPELWNKMDHRPVRGFIQILPRDQGKITNPKKDNEREKITKLQGAHQTNEFRKKLYETTRKHYDLQGLQHHIKAALREASQRPRDSKEDEAQEARKRCKELRTLRRIEPDEFKRKEIMKQIWRLIRKIATFNATRKINTLKLRPKQEIHLPTTLRIQNEDSTDRELWVEEAKKFGESRFGDEEGRERRHDKNTQADFRPRARVMNPNECKERSQNEVDRPITLWDMLRARAEMKTGRAPGTDGITTDIYRLIPFMMIPEIGKLFTQRLEGNEDSPPSWKELQFVAIPKPDRVDGLQGFRWICVSDVLQKWYLRLLRAKLREEARKTSLHAYGFREATSTCHLTGVLREALCTAEKWSYPIHIAIQDVETAFDSVPHWLIEEALIHQGVKPRTTQAIMAEYSDLRAKIKIPEVGTSDWFTYTKGAKQGGVETPDIWKIVLDYLFDPVISQWAEKQWGFKVKDEDGELITTLSHGIFADNVIIISDTLLTLQNMIDELTEALQKPRNNKGESYLRWKPKSLESMHNDRTNITQHNEARGEEPGDALLSDHGSSNVQHTYRPGSEPTRWKPPTDRPIPPDLGSRYLPDQRKRNQEDPREG